MNLHDIDPTHCGTLLELREDRALTLRMKKDIGLHAFAGTVWITREGDIDDVILGPRETYVARRGRPIVLSALGGRALAQVYEAGEQVPTLQPTPEVIATVHSYASALRRTLWSDTARHLAAWIGRLACMPRVTLRAWLHACFRPRRTRGALSVDC